MRLVPLRDKIIGIALLLGAFPLVFAATTMLGHSPTLAPETIEGCYISDLAPAISLEHGMVRFDEPHVGSPKFTVEHGKQGFDIQIHEAISPKSDGLKHYSFSQDTRGIGWFWPLTEKEGHESPLYRYDKFTGVFSVIASDGRYLLYRRVAEGRACFAKPG